MYAIRAAQTSGRLSKRPFGGDVGEQTGHRVAAARGSRRLFSTNQMAFIGTNNKNELTLATAILLRDESFRRVEMAARDIVLERLTLENQADSLARIYRESTA